MNERIKALIKQSYDELNEPNHDPVVRELLMKDLLPEYQRFAELIVEAICYDIMNLHGCDPERVQMAARKFGVTV